MAPTGRQTGELASPLGIPWPLWVVFVSSLFTFVVAAVVVREAVIDLRKEFNMHVGTVGHVGMQNRMTAIEAEVRHNSQDIYSLEQWRLSQ